MKKNTTILLLISMCLFSIPIKAITNDTEQPTVYVQLDIIDIDNTNNGDNGDNILFKPIKRSKRIITESPKLEYGDHVLYYNTVCEDAVFVLIQNGTVTYEDDFNSAGIYELPINLNGTYDIHLYVGNKVYVGTLVL